MDLTNSREAERAIKKVLDISDDPHNIFTPFPLCRELVEKIPSLEGNILVIANLEFIFVLLDAGVNADCIYFATCCTQKARLATAFGIPKNNIIIYKSIPTKEDMNNMPKFDVVIGNPPYEHDLAYEFMKLVTTIIQDKGFVAFIVPSGFMTQPTKRKLRESLTISHGFKTIKLLPAGTFKTYDNKDVLRQTIMYIAQVGYEGCTTYMRPTGEPIALNLNTEDPWFHFYNEISRSIWKKAQAYSNKICVKWWTNNKPYNPDTSCVHFSEKTDAVYVARVTSKGTTRNTIADPKFGASIHTGVLSSTIPPTIEQLKNKRAYVNTTVPESVIGWMKSHLYGILLSMATTTQDITKASVGIIPLIEVDGDFTEEKAYDVLGLTPKEREWLIKVKI